MKLFRFGILFGVLGLGVAFAVFADTLALREDHPQTYVVKKGDTLWDISTHFLKSPWLWPRLWQANPQVDNPHLIYPGDQLNLIYVDGEPRLVRKRMVKLSPQVRIEPKLEPIPTLPLSIINPFLSKDHIISPDAVNDAPFVVGNNRSELTFQKGQVAYVQGKLDLDESYGIYRLGHKYKDPDSDEVLGLSVVYLGMARVVKQEHGQPATINIVEGVKEIKINDILLPMPDLQSYPAYFMPSPSQLEAPGYIIDSYNYRSVVSKYDIVLISKGSRDGVKQGDVFGVSEAGVVVVHNKDRVGYKEDATVYSRLFDGSDMVPLPQEQVGELMVFRTYEKLSYALIVRAREMISKGDMVNSL